MVGYKFYAIKLINGMTQIFAKNIEAALLLAVAFHYKVDIDYYGL